MSRERRQVFYEGRVQGVGFRYTSARLSEGREVSGFVHNLADGRVELQAQGDPARLADFLASIHVEFGSKIRRADEATIPVVDDETAGDFRILT